MWTKGEISERMVKGAHKLRNQDEKLASTVRTSSRPKRTGKIVDFAWGISPRGFVEQLKPEINFC